MIFECLVECMSSAGASEPPFQGVFRKGESFYLFSEGGLKFRALRDNKHVGFAIYEPYDGFNKLKSLQVMGVADMVEPFSEVYMMMLDYKKIPVDAIKKMPQPMNLIKIMPESYDYLDSDLKKDGVGIRQHLDME